MHVLMNPRYYSLLVYSLLVGTLLLLSGCDGERHTFLTASEFEDRFGRPESLGDGDAGSSDDDADDDLDDDVDDDLDDDLDDDTGDDDTGDDAGTAMADAGIACDPGLEPCGMQCVDTQEDAEHCGACDSACPEDSACVDGDCVCDGELSLCEGSCVDLQNDINFCGDCDNPCPGDEVCQQGQCRPDCSQGLRLCDDRCADTNVDTEHCGACGNDCDPGQVCSGGFCVADCQAPFVACGTSCKDLTNDLQNCGGCGDVCDPGEDCINSQCEVVLEDCTNGVDDNNDNLVDCADPNCQAGYRCMPNAPSGWTAIALSTVGQGQVPACAGAYSNVEVTDLHQNPTGDPLACSCNCNTNGQTCELEPIVWEGTNCGGIPWTLDPSQWFETGECGEILLPVIVGDPPAESITATLHPPANTTGTCQTNIDNRPEVDWEFNALGCALPSVAGAGCGGGTQCLPSPPQGIIGMCAYRIGVWSCPAAFPDRQIFHTDVTDARDCGCGCTVTCPDFITEHTGDQCTNDPTTVGTQVPTDGTCTPIELDPSTDPTYNQMGTTYYDETRSYEIPAATCPGVVQTSGGVTGVGSVTVCCE